MYRVIIFTAALCIITATGYFGFGEYRIYAALKETWLETERLRIDQCVKGKSEDVLMAMDVATIQADCGVPEVLLTDAIAMVASEVKDRVADDR